MVGRVLGGGPKLVCALSGKRRRCVRLGGNGCKVGGLRVRLMSPGIWWVETPESHTTKGYLIFRDSQPLSERSRDPFKGVGLDITRSTGPKRKRELIESPPVRIVKNFGHKVKELHISFMKRPHNSSNSP